MSWPVTRTIIDALSVAAGWASMVATWCLMVVNGSPTSFSTIEAAPWNCCASNESIEWSR